MTRIQIRYCTQCQWPFGEQLTEVALSPSHGGTFEIWCGDTLLWERKRDGGFPDIKTLKQQVRDQIDPARDLGHIDR